MSYSAANSNHVAAYVARIVSGQKNEGLGTAQFA